MCNVHCVYKNNTNIIKYTVLFTNNNHFVVFFILHCFECAKKVLSWKKLNKKKTRLWRKSRKSFSSDTYLRKQGPRLSLRVKAGWRCTSVCRNPLPSSRHGRFAAYPKNSWFPALLFTPPLLPSGLSSRNLTVCSLHSVVTSRKKRCCSKSDLRFLSWQTL